MMERLTYEGNFCDISRCTAGPGGEYCKEAACSQKQVWERLKQYEDSGLSPNACAEAKEANDALEACDYPIKRLCEIVTADKDGRVVVLPCEVGHAAYWVHNGIITDCRINRIQANRKGVFLCLKSIKAHGAFRVDTCLGKTVFLTREEAEKALAELEGK